MGKLGETIAKLTSLNQEKEQVGKLSPVSVENMKQLAAQLSQQKKAIEDKLDDAEKKGQISGSTLDNLKKSVENLDKIENFVEDTAEGLGFGIFGDTTTKQPCILSQSVNAL